MKLHLVGGFLGSGKTTAIANAARQLIQGGQRVGVITNDQGKYLVDTAFFAAQSTPVTAVTGGCFCCNYDQLTDHLAQLIADHQPDVVFAESVGSCADIVATVINPLLDLAPFNPASFSVFVDCRLLQLRLQGAEMPFSEDVVYIFDEQIAEANLLILNKADRLSEGEAKNLLGMAAARYPDKRVILQNSLDEESIRAWVQMIGAVGLPQQVLDIDYDRYAKGEQQLAWVNKTITLKQIPVGKTKAAICDMIRAIVTPLYAQQGNCHIKFLIQDSEQSAKVSFVSIMDEDWESQIPAFAGDAVEVLINARLETQLEALTEIMDHALRQVTTDYQLVYHKENCEGFYPAEPTPQYRMDRSEKL